MELTNKNNERVKITISGYQFPNVTKGEHDSNWLSIYGEITHQKGSWTFCDPCFLTWEINELSDWIENIGTGVSTESELEFIEPVLIFRRQNQNTLRLFFELGARPNWAKFEGIEEDLWIDFEADELSFRRAANSLRDQLEKYPIR